MKVQISFKVLDPDYDQEYANQYHFGEESESNSKYIWASTYEVIGDVDHVSYHDNDTFHLFGETIFGQKFSYQIPDVKIFRCHMKDGEVQDYAVSKSILHQTYQPKNEKYKTLRFYFYIKGEIPSIEMGNLVINMSEIPTEHLELMQRLSEQQKNS